jgi:ubiquinone biosynthesis protein COQ9
MSQEILQVLPNSHRTIAEFCKLDLESKIAMYESLKNEDITLQEFKEKFRLP